MGMIRWCLVMCLMWPLAGVAQTDDKVARPGFQYALGLLKTTPLIVEGKVPFEAKVPETNEVSVRINQEVEGALAAVEFAAPGNTFLETVIFATAEVDLGDTQARTFGLANLLVLRTFAQLQQTFPDARIIGFSPIKIGEYQAVQMVGAYAHDQLGPTVFRHVGIMQEDRREVLLALINLSAERMPARNNTELDDSYSGWMLRNLTFPDGP